MRTMKIKYPVLTYEEREIELIPYLKKVSAEAYWSRETESVEIRIPTKWEGCSNCCGYIPLEVIEEDTEEIWEQIYGAGLYPFLEKYENEIFIRDL